MKLNRISILFVLILSTFSVKGQDACDTLEFIDCSKNVISGVYNNNFKELIQKFKNIDSEDSKAIQIVHIGDSHLQAGFISEKIKQELFTEFLTIENSASPGFIFPYTIAQTNNPYYYKVDYTGDWDWCKNVDKEKKCNLGLSGITLETTDSVASICIRMDNVKYNKPQNYYFDKIKIYHNYDEAFSLKTNGINTTYEQGFSIANFKSHTDSVMIQISINDTSKSFELYGIILENNKSKINYHTIGVNGATAQSYLKCNYFSNQLTSINPDLIIISLGTNEAYDEDISPLEQEYILKDLILQVKDVTPNAAIVLTTPNDHMKKAINNTNVPLIRNNILKICQEFELAYWDFYGIMGGNQSIINWYNKGLTGEDKLHFRKKGYEIQGDLFVKAFIKYINNPTLLGMGSGN